MKEGENELRFVVSIVNPFEVSYPSKSDFSCLDEQRLVKILVRNKILRKVDRKLREEPQLRKSFLSRFNTLNKLIIQQEGAQEKEFNEFIRISQKLAKQNIHLLLIKSTGEFPHESSNIDCLIESEKLAATIQVLEEEGYQEYPSVREPHKFLFRKKNASKELPLHIHTRVEWEAIDFANLENLRGRARFLPNKDTGALIPSVEDAILITIAHYFFEDHEIRINDLLNLCITAKDEQIDWNYVLSQAREIGWEDALLLNTKILNQMSSRYFGRDFLPNFGERFLNNSSIFLRRNPYGVFEIPYAMSAGFFLQRVLTNSQYSLNEKFRQIVYVFSDVIGRKILGYDELK